MSNKNSSNIWLIWLALMLTLSVYFTFLLIEGEDKSVFMPGELTGGHHQIGIACDACHGESFSNKDDIQEKCFDCHGDQRQKPFDSHPRSKFTDPRNADRLENIDATYCVSCHVEHKPDLDDKTGVTQAKDFCVHCHQDIAKDRPSHKGMEFDTCASSGCHNYHNNRALYTDFLVKHMDESDVLEKPAVEEKEFSSVLEEIITYPHDSYPVKKLTQKDIDAPATILVKMDAQISHSWKSTAHAQSGANCTSCHMKTTDGTKKSEWTNTPDHTACETCHDVEVKHFKQGKHGMRLNQNLPTMTPADARLPMKPEAYKNKLDCNSCHQPHRYNLQTAAIDSCLECHDDKHSLAYKDSSHFELWNKELKGELPSGSGVSCATCHMPRVSIDVNDWLRRTVVQHNQNATLTPNEKMIRPVCLNCHGLGFSIDSLADEKLVDSNFNAKPSIHIQSIDMAKQDNIRHLQRIQDE